jgi:hypothetical protein
VSDGEIAAKVGVHSQNLANCFWRRSSSCPRRRPHPTNGSGGGRSASEARLCFGCWYFTMRGRWSPRAAKRDFDDHDTWSRRSWQRSNRRGSAPAKRLLPRPRDSDGLTASVTSPSGTLTSPRTGFPGSPRWAGAVETCGYAEDLTRLSRQGSCVIGCEHNNAGTRGQRLGNWHCPGRFRPRPIGSCR